MLTSKVIGATAAADALLEFVDVGAVNSGSSPTVDIPTADLQAGDLLVLCVASGGDTTIPSGWSRPFGVNQPGGSSTRTDLFYKISDGAETDFTLGNGQSRTQCGVIHYRPIGGDVVFGAVVVDEGSSITAATVSQPISTLPALIVSHFVKASNTTDIGTVSGTNQRLLGNSNGTYTNLRVVDEFPSATGASTVRSETSYNDKWFTTAAAFYALKQTSPPEFIAAASALDSGSSVTVSVPTGTQDGDLMIAFTAAGGTAGTWTPPTGWTEVVDQGVSPSLSVMYRIALSEPSNYLFTSTGTAVGCAIVTIRNSTFIAAGSFGTGSTTVVAPSVSTGLGYLALYSADGSGNTWSTPTDTTNIVTADGLTLTLAAFLNTDVVGSTGNVSSTYNASSTAAGILISLGPV
jgi:hypothetical protein